jgi:hypothetical protein
MPGFTRTPQTEGLYLNIALLKAAKQRKDVLQPYFSTSSILRLEPTIIAKVTGLVNLMYQAPSRDEVVDLSLPDN